jgi:hypothetical protein
MQQLQVLRQHFGPVAEVGLGRLNACIMTLLMCG